MLHDDISARKSEPSTKSDRRRKPRVPYPAELVLAWHCSMSDLTRYRIIDVSDGGFRIRSSTPLPGGMTGTVLRILPEGHQVAAAVMVVWCRESRQRGEYDVGLRRI